MDVAVKPVMVAATMILAGLLGAPSVAAPVATTGTISGTISLATGDPHGPAYIPAGSVIEVRVGYLSGNPAAPHVTVTATATYTVNRSDDTSMPFVMTGIDFANALDVEADVHSLNKGPHEWSAPLTRTDRRSAAVSLTSSSPRVSGIAFAASGITVPLTATADGVTPLGSIAGFIEITRHGDRPLPTALAAGTRVIAFAVGDANASELGTSTIQPLSSYDGRTGRAYFSITGLPIATPLVLRVAAPDGGTPALTYRASTAIGPNASAPGFVPAGDTWHVQLTFERRDVSLATLFVAQPLAPAP